MSIFDSTSGWDSTEWLQEKSLAALESAVKIVDLANEPDTTPWYAKNLKRIAEHLIARLVPMTALFHGVGDEGVKSEEWQNIVERGTFALTKWCRKWNIANPYRFSEGVTAREREESETAEKSRTVQPAVETGEDEQSCFMKLEIYSHMALQMLHGELTTPAKRLLSWALFHLYTSEYHDIVVLNKAFLPTDIGCTPEETGEGYRLLYQKGLIEKIEGLKITDEAIALRLVVGGLNDSKHPTPFQEETFGRKGLRIGGKITTGNIIQLSYDKLSNKYLQWLARSQDKLRQLSDFLEESIGEDNCCIEDIRVIVKADEPKDTTVLEIQIRYPLDVDDRIMEEQLKIYAKKWIDQSKSSVLEPNK
jgi:hypothetical protein